MHNTCFLDDRYIDIYISPVTGMSYINVIKKEKFSTLKLSVCECCGAPLESTKCEYCGSIYAYSK